MKKIAIMLSLLIFGVASAQDLPKNVRILKNWKIENTKDFSTKSSFKINENGKSTSVFLEINSENVSLKNAVSKNVIELYANKAPITISKANCQTQIAAQWLYFKSTIYPTILIAANKTCKAQRYCLMTYCNGNPFGAYMLLIQPNGKCPLERIDYVIPD